MADDGSFLDRWSRRKVAVRQGEPVPPALQEAPAPLPVAAAVPVAPTPPVDVPAAPALPTLEDAHALTPAADFSPFVQRGVAPEVRNVAMKKLFADPHFNVMDGLDTYIDDYSKSDPIPLAMLRQMTSARFLQLFEEEQETPQGVAAGVHPASAVQPATTLSPEPAETPPAPDQPSPPAVVPPGIPTASQTHHADTDLRLQPDDAAQPLHAGGSAG